MVKVGVRIADYLSYIVCLSVDLEFRLVKSVEHIIRRSKVSLIIPLAVLIGQMS